MSDSEVVAALVAEVDQFMRAGRVGIYEFLEILRSDHPGLDAQTARSVSVEALDRLLTSGAARLEWVVWADPSYQVPADGVTPREQDWQTPGRDPYLAVVPT